VLDFQSETFDADLAWELDHLRAVGIRRVVAIDLTRPELHIPVVRVVIPGLEGPPLLANYLPGARVRAHAPVAP
jgi:ribosomal protein S12 methylthiotransferase accessory factor